METYVPFYRAFDCYTKHCWVGRATALVTQLIVLPLSTAFGFDTFCMHTLGMYILHDSLHCALYEKDAMTWIHHVATLGGYMYIFWAPADIVHLMVVATMLLESTSPLIQVCWFVNKSGYSGAKWFPYLAGATLLMYLVVRCIYFPYFVFLHLPGYSKLLGAVFTALNWMWFYKLIGYAQNVLKKSGSARLE